MLPTPSDPAPDRPQPPATHHRSVTDIGRLLADWRAAERELDAMSAEDPGWEAAVTHAADARLRYHEHVEDREHERLTELSPFTLQHG